MAFAHRSAVKPTILLIIARKARTPERRVILFSGACPSEIIAAIGREKFKQMPLVPQNGSLKAFARAVNKADSASIPVENQSVFILLPKIRRVDFPIPERPQKSIAPNRV